MFTGKSITSYVSGHDVTNYVTLAEARLQNNIASGDTTFDTELAIYLNAAFRQVENWIGYSIRKANVKYAYSGLLSNGEIRVYSKVHSVTSVKYLDENEDEQDIEAKYQLWDSLGLTIYVTGSAATLSKSETNYVVNFVEGYDISKGVGNTESQVFPVALKQAILMLTSLYFTNRQPVAFGGNPQEIPLTYQALISPYQITKFT